MFELLGGLVVGLCSLVSGAADSIIWDNDPAVYWTEDQGMDDCRFIPMDDD